MLKKIFISSLVFFSFSHLGLAHQNLFKQKLSDEQRQCLKQEREKCWDQNNFFSENQKQCIRKCHAKAKGWKKSKMECKKRCDLPELTEEQKEQRYLCKKQIHQACGIQKRKNNLSREQKQCIKESRKECLQKHDFFTKEQKKCIRQCKKSLKNDDRSRKSDKDYKRNNYGRKSKEFCRKQCDLLELTEEQKNQKKKCKQQSYKYCNIINK